MIEVFGNLWDYPADAHCITTNGAVKKNGNCVMGRGCALEATKIFPGVERQLGRLITNNGNVAQLIGHPPPVVDEVKALVAFPVKHNWFEKADPRLIKRSANQLVDIVDEAGWETVVVPRPGVGNGQLSWSEVKPLLEGILDDRFHLITF